MTQAAEPAAAPGPLARLAPLLPLIAAGAARTEREQRLAAAADLLEAGLFRLLMPLSVGGLQTDPATFLHVVERAGHADASTGWCIAQTSVCSMAAALLRPEAARTVFAEPHAVLAWGFGPPGRAVPQPGGWRVSGRWSFGSGLHLASWLGGSCTVCDPAGQPVLDHAGNAATRMMLFRRADATVHPDWDVVGLRGTGSDTYAVDGAVVPEDLAFQFGAPVQPHARAPLYAIPPDALWAAGFAAVSLGAARAALDALLDLARRKTPRAAAATLAHAPAVQSAVAETEAALLAARLLLHDAAAAAFREAGEEAAVGLHARMAVRLAASHAIRAARAAVERCYHAAGSDAVFAANGFERRLRDMHMISQHIHGRAQHFETVGRFMLGLPASTAFL